jgi:UDP-N-acetylmuramate dehydrogenase
MSSPSQQADLIDLNTLGIPSTADWLHTITDSSQLAETATFAANHSLPLLVLGGGSNIVLGEAELHCVVLHIAIPGREVIAQTDRYTEVRVGAGENWDELVAWSVKQGLRGIESLSLIPGTVGAAPIQNIGAYGQELSQSLVAVDAYDLTTNSVVTLSNAACEFSYRDSIFKHAGKGRYVVTSVTLRLVPAELAPPPTYASLQAELERRHITAPTVADIRAAVIAIRSSKLPDPAVTPTAGSFFHNPIVPASELDRLLAAHPDLPHWPATDGQVKLSGGWLIEQCGLKGTSRDGVGLSDKSALVLVNPGHLPAAKVLAFRDSIVATVRDTFGVTLQMEPELITF